MKRLHPALLLSLLLGALLAVSVGCEDDDPGAQPDQVQIVDPLADETVTDCTVDLQFSFGSEMETEPSLLIDGVLSEVDIVESSKGWFTATLGADQIAPGSHEVEVVVTREADGVRFDDRVRFEWEPRARAYTITDPGDLITGPLAHNRVGDFMLESCVARFAVQDGGQRDLYSVGQYGGNLIDAELIGRPGLDNFLEVQAMVNVETVVNAQTVFIVNDGEDGEAAVVRACGPDDLLDFVNPSSRVTDVGIVFPDELNENNQTVEGCTDYAVEVFDSHVAMTTTFTNTGDETIALLSGDWLNAAGELQMLGTPNPGLGTPLTNDLDALGFFGYDEARGIDYAYSSLPDAPGSYVVIDGVTVILHDKDVLYALLGLVGGTEVAPGESYVIRRFFGVGDGSGSNAVDLASLVKGIGTAQMSGCVTVDGEPAPGAVVTVGQFDPAGAMTDVATSFVTDDEGCYSGLLPTPDSPTLRGAVAGRRGTPYQGGETQPEIHSFEISTGEALTLDFDLPPTGVLRVTATDESGGALPVRVSVVGFDPSPPIRQPGVSLPGFGGSDLGLFVDPDDQYPFGIVDAVFTGADGEVEFDLEPGSYRVVVSRGVEYSFSDHPVTMTAGAVTEVEAVITAVLDTAGFVSSDFHVHGINSADSRVSHRKRAEGYAGEGVDNIVMTDHHVHTDLDPTIEALGLSDWVSSTIGEEITTFDYGHFNAYPLTIDPSLPSGGSTDWAKAADPGEDFPSLGNYNATPSEIVDLALNGSRSTPDTTIQVNHIGSYFNPLRIDTGLEAPVDDLDEEARLARRIGAPLSENLFYPFPALELWNGHTRGAQDAFREARIGVWFNLLSRGYRTTFIADTDSHRHHNLRVAGARTWTAASPGSDEAGLVDDGEVARMVTAGKATGGQGVFITTVLRGAGGQADLTHDGVTTLAGEGETLALDIRVQAPVWAPFDTIEIYANAETTSRGESAPYEYSATPTRTRSEGDCDPSTLGDGDFDLTVVDVAPTVAGGQRLEVSLTETFVDVDEDTWFVVVARGRDGFCPALFPVFPASLTHEGNVTPDDLMDGNVGEQGVLSLGASNALYYDVVAP
ncbi:MAG: hypothetical protein VX252_12195 [Myxococcota bacterium]|nr:hypothetical protein [Myxococcota bacterium]